LKGRALVGPAIETLSAELNHVTDISSRRRLSSSDTDTVLVRTTRLYTVDDWAFPVASARLWNKLPSDDVTASVSLTALRHQLQTLLFRVSYPDSLFVLHYTLTISSITLILHLA